MWKALGNDQQIQIGVRPRCASAHRSEGHERHEPIAIVVMRGARHLRQQSLHVLPQRRHGITLPCEGCEGAAGSTAGAELGDLLYLRGSLDGCIWHAQRELGPTQMAGDTIRGMTRAWLLIAMSLSCCVTSSAESQAQALTRPMVIVAEIDGIIHPVSAEFLIGAINVADTSSADLLVLILRTPGGLLDSTQAMISRMIISRAPVVVFVWPAGARAASAGFVLLLAADVAVMAPGTHTGAAHPVAGTGDGMDDTTAKKAASDVAAYVRSIAEARGRNVPLAADAVLESRAFTDREALHAHPPLIDFTASNIDDLLRQLDGRPITRFDGRPTVLRTGGADVRRVEMTRRQHFLSAIAHPQIAYLLMTLGLLGLTVELWNPGAIVPGVAGGLCLLLAFFAFQILPVSTTGLLLVVFGIALLLLELKVPSFGALGIGGATSLLIGSVMMTDVVPGLRAGFGIVIPVTLAFAAVFLVLGRLAMKAHRLPASTGSQTLIGQHGRTRTPIAPDAPGQVGVRGEIWRAVSREALPPGHTVRIIGVNGLTLIVETADASLGEGAGTWKV
jgi:membrane-bound serine protease (ClpP class)